MNRQEIIEQLKLIQAGLTQDDNNKSKNRIDAVIENLKQPITLADFLGWEENAIYTDGNIYYKIQNGNLFFKTKNGKIPQLWNLSGYNDYFNYCYKFRQLDKVEIEKNRGARIMNIDNLIKELQQIDIEKLTDDELGEFADNMKILANKFANEVIKRYVMNGGKFFKNE